MSIARNLSALRIVEHGKNTSVTSGVTFTNAISLRCDPRTFDGGATYRSRLDQSEPSSRHATRNGTINNNNNMRVHACRHCGDVFPSYPDLRQHLDSHLQPPNVCPTCKRSFTRTAELRRHSSRCTPKPFVCDVCRSSFTRKRDLDRHTNTVRCGAPQQPEPAPKRQKVTHLREDRRRRSNPLMTNCRPSCGTLYKKTGQACGHTWSTAQCRRGTTTG